jgi:LysR family tcuABC transcriptional regulator
MLMDAVRAGLACTIQPHAALARFADAGEAFETARISDSRVRRPNFLCSVSDEELSPAALAVRVTLTDCARELVRSRRWTGARLIHHEN